MNSSHGQTLPRFAGRINWQAITLVGGLALAIGAVIGVGALDQSREQSAHLPSTSQTAEETYIDTPASMVRPLVLIVGSERQATAIENAIVADEMAEALRGNETYMQSISIVVVDSPDKEYLYDAVLADQMGSGTFDVKDLRN